MTLSRALILAALVSVGCDSTGYVPQWCVDSCMDRGVAARIFRSAGSVTCRCANGATQTINSDRAVEILMDRAETMKFVAVNDIWPTPSGKQPHMSAECARWFASGNSCLDHIRVEPDQEAQR